MIRFVRAALMCAGLALVVVSTIGAPRPAHADLFDDIAGGAGPAADQANKLFDKGKYTDAIPYFEAALKSKSKDAQFLFRFASSCTFGDKAGRAEEIWRLYAKATTKPLPAYWFRRGLSTEKLGFLDKAAAWHRKYVELHGDDPKLASFTALVRTKLRYLEGAPAVRAATTTMPAPVNIGAPVNTKGDDYMPQADPTGRVLYLTGRRKPMPAGKEADEDMYKSVRDGDGWTAPVALPAPVNGTQNDGAAAFSADGQMLVFIGCGRTDGIGGRDLYTADLEGDAWTRPRNLGDVVNSKVWDSQPSLSSDGGALIFASIRDGGFGDEDLYISHRDRDGAWTRPINMGHVINTPYSELSPFLSPDGKTLYFASTGHPGHGGYDLFVTVNDNGRWSEPVNLGLPLNSTGDDRYFTIEASGELAYFASDRSGGLGGKDLYRIALPEAMRPKPTVIV